MRTTIRSLAFALAGTLGLAASAQQQYPVTVYGVVSGCTGNTSVNIATMPNTWPAIDIDVPVQAPNCTFFVTLTMSSQGGGFVISTPCLGAIQSQTVQYQINPVNGDSAMVSVIFNCGSNTPDCLGVPGGSALPGSACTTALGQAGVWSADCTCETNALVDCEGVPNGPAMPGTPCEENGLPGLYSPWCWCDTTAFMPDCLGVPGGTAWPGTPCTVESGGMVYTGTFNVDCACDTTTFVLYDCLQIANGPNMPGTPCTNPATGESGLWSPDCICVSDTTGGAYDCLGVLNGNNLPGTPCWTPGTNFIGTWDANCNCSNGGGLPCQAGFWVIQAYGQDSLPVPNEVWVWNLSTGNGALTYLWNFGDGTSSTDAYPTHTYSGNGPYNLCLTIADASGCTSTTCDSISIDENGMINGMVINGEANADGARDSGFTLNVQNPLTTSVSEVPALSSVALWPNPATDELKMALVALADGSLNVTLFDVNGREVRQENRAINAGRNQHRFDISELPAGLYTARATDRNGNSISLRFAKAN